MLKTDSPTSPRCFFHFKNSYFADQLWLATLGDVNLHGRCELTILHNTCMKDHSSNFCIKMRFFIILIRNEIIKNFGNPEMIKISNA